MDTTLKERIKQLGIKSSRIGGTGSMRMKAKKKRKQPKEYIEEIQKTSEENENTLDEDIVNLEQQLNEIKN